MLPEFLIAIRCFHEMIACLSKFLDHCCMPVAVSGAEALLVGARSVEGSPATRRGGCSPYSCAIARGRADG